MIPRRWSMLVSVLVLALVMATAGSARAQGSFYGIPGSPSVSQFGPGSEIGTAYGLSPLNYGSFAGVGFGGLGSIGAFPLPGYGRSIGRRPLAATIGATAARMLARPRGLPGEGTGA